MAKFVGRPIVVGDTDDVHDSEVNKLGTRAFDEDGNEYIFLLGVANTVAGSWVTFDESFATALLAASAVGPVAVAQAAIVANKYGWYGVRGTFSASVAASCADNSANIGREGADGVAGDGRAAGDAIIGAITRAATTDAANISVQILYPQVNDATGS